MSNRLPNQNSVSNRNSDAVREQLREQILSLPVPAFEHLIAHLLNACGYQDVQVLASSQSGADLSARSLCGLSKAVTLVQAKQYRTPVSRRFVDELRGAMIRTGAQQGLLLTTSTFYSPAHRAAWKECSLPVRLVDGSEMMDVLISHNLGIVTSSKGRIKLDRKYFEQLRRDHASSPRPQQRPHVKPHAASCQGGRRSWLDILRGA